MKIIFLLVIILFSFLVNKSQTSNHLLNDKPSVYLTYEKSGERKSLVTQKYESNQGIWLRLHNNTLKPIAVHANYEVDRVKTITLLLSNGIKAEGLANDSEVEICYQTEAMPVTITQQTYNPQSKDIIITEEVPFEVKVPKQTPSYYSCQWSGLVNRKFQVSWVASGNSIVFSVPREYLEKNLKIYTLYNYEWEIENSTLKSPGWVKSGEPNHQVFFNFLP